MPKAAPRVCWACWKPIAAYERCRCRKEVLSPPKVTPRPAPRERGYGREWEAARARFLAEHIICEACGNESATVVHHKLRAREHQAEFMNPKHWQAMCKGCHDSTAQRAEKREERERRFRAAIPGGGRRLSR